MLLMLYETMMVSSLFRPRVQRPLSPQGKSFCCILCSFYSSFQQMLSKRSISLAKRFPCTRRKDARTQQAIARTSQCRHITIPFMVHIQSHLIYIHSNHIGQMYKVGCLYLSLRWPPNKLTLQGKPSYIYAGTMLYVYEPICNGSQRKNNSNINVKQEKNYAKAIFRYVYCVLFS